MPPEEAEVELRIETDPIEERKKAKRKEWFLDVVEEAQHTMESEPKLEELSNKILAILCSETEIEGDDFVGLPGLNRSLAYSKPQGVGIDDSLLQSMKTFKELEFSADNLAAISD